MSASSARINTATLLLVTAVLTPPIVTNFTPNVSSVVKMPVPKRASMTSISIVYVSFPILYAVLMFSATSLPTLPISSMACASNKNAFSGEITKSVSISNVSTIICAPTPSFKSYV